MTETRQPTYEGEITNEISIDVSSIPDFVRDELVAPLLAIVTDYFKEPGVEERYQEWLKNRKTRRHPPR